MAKKKKAMPMRAMSAKSAINPAARSMNGPGKVVKYKSGQTGAGARAAMSC